MKQTQSYDAVVMGGGIIGLTTALALGDAGYRVALLEASACGQEASWAGGGILMPLYPWRYPLALLPLLLRSLEATTALVHRIKRVTGIDPELNCSGMLVKGLSETEALEAKLWAEQADWPMSLNPETHGLLSAWLPSVSNIRNPRLIKGLVALLSSHRYVNVLEHLPVLSFKHRNGAGDLWQVSTLRSVFSAPYVICTAGAWSGKLLESAGMGCGPMRPVLGQMLLLHNKAYQGRPMLLDQGLYHVPRKDGHLLVGSTMHYNGFQKKLCPNSYQSLVDFAVASLGPDAQASIQGYWAGLRPDAGQPLPVIGEHPHHRGLWLNTGHFRNGLVLAAGSAQHLTDRLLQNNDKASRRNPFAVKLPARHVEHEFHS